MKQNFRRSSTNRRAISPELMLQPLYANAYKQEMKISLVNQQVQSATYQAMQKRYTQTQSKPMPVFQDKVMTTNVQFTTEQLSSGTTSSISSFEALKSNSSFKNVFERVAKQQASKMLKESPKNAQEHQYATRGIIPYGE